MIKQYDSANDTLKHIEHVAVWLGQVIENLQARGMKHDLSKLKEPEKAIFDAVTPKLKTLTYGSEEYKAALTEMGEALAHHYAHNSHHPEHYPNGIEDMSLLDLVEMFCDWKAASLRHADGDFGKSLEINRQRFAVSDQLARIFENTCRELGW